MINLDKTILAAQGWLDNEADPLNGLSDQEEALAVWAVGHGSDADIPPAARPILAMVCKAIGTSR